MPLTKVEKTALPPCCRYSTHEPKRAVIAGDWLKEPSPAAAHER